MWTLKKLKTSNQQMFKLKLMGPLFLLLLSSFITAQPQEQTTGSHELIRLELETKADAEPFHILPFGKQGMLIFYQSVATTDDKDHIIWVFKLYDINFNQLWIQQLPVLKGLVFSEAVNEGPFLYLAFYNPDNNTSGHNFQIVKVPGKEDLIRAKTYRVPPKSSLTQFSVFNQTAYYGIETKDNEAFLYRYEMTSGTMDSIRMDNGNGSLVLDLQIDTVDRDITVYFKEFVEKTSEDLFLRHYDEFLKPKGSSILIKNDENLHIIKTGQYLPLDDDGGLIFGTYQDNPKGKYDQHAGDVTMESTGFYVVRITGDTCRDVKYHNFSEFNSFYKNLSINDLSRIRKGKNQELTVDYNLLIHNVIPVNDEFVFVAEAYYPEYHTVTRMEYDWYGRPIPSNYSVFDGYRYTSAFIAAFDDEGNLKWDNGLELWDILSGRLEKRVNVIFEGPETVMAYLLNGEIAYKVIKKQQDVENLNYVKIDTKYARDKMVSESGSNMAYWYKNFFLAYGYQAIKNSTLPDKSKRTVFYVNKIQLD